MHDVCWTYAKETTAVYFEVFTFDAYMYSVMLKFYAFFNDLIIDKKSIFSQKFVAYASSLHVAGVWPVVAYILRHQAI